MTTSHWDPDKLKSALNTRVIGREFKIFQELDSTNQYAFEIALKGAEEGTVILADQQSRGRGRMGRDWVSPPGVGIYVTVILRPKSRVGDLPKYTLLASVAVAEAVRDVTGLQAVIKWPNDVLIEGKKFCGILEESMITGNKIGHLVIGIGINVNTDPADLPETPKGAPTSLKAERGETVDRNRLLTNLLQKLDSGYSDILEGKGINIVHKWRGLSATLGRRVRVEMSGSSIEGQAVDIDDDGSLLISKDGELQKINSGDIIHMDY
jgi:BirA family biotin operon repressor/biotin-[acetyl-CoA-carboxylase] ligase